MGQFGSKLSAYQPMASPQQLNLLMSILGEWRGQGWWGWGAAQNTGESGQLPSNLAPCSRFEHIRNRKHPRLCVLKALLLGYCSEARCL